MADIEYEIKPTLPLTAPKEKLSYIENNHTKLGNSQFIIHYLEANYKNLDETLNNKQIYGHGIGQHKAKEIFKIGTLDINVISDLGGNNYFLGEKPSTLDASAFGILINAL